MPLPSDEQPAESETRSALQAQALLLCTSDAISDRQPGPLLLLMKTRPESFPTGASFHQAAPSQQDSRSVRTFGARSEGTGIDCAPFV